MSSSAIMISNMLWFDVERRYKTISKQIKMLYGQLWFDVERRYKTILLPVQTGTK